MLRLSFLELEKKLLEKEVRSNPEEIRKYLESGFIEFCSSGKIYHYAEGDVFDLNQNSNISYKIIDFEIKELSTDIVLAMYKVEKSDLNLNTSQISLRSSIWRKTNDEWKIVFHQGTNMN